jgi:hypothetical protein
VNGIDPLGLILFDDSSSFALALLGRTLDPRALFENIASGDSFRVASAYSYHALMAPYHMAQAVYHSPAAVAALWDLDLDELKCLLKDKYHDFLYAPPEQQMEMLAALTGDAAGAWATGAGAANALKALRAAQAAKGVNNAAHNAADAVKLNKSLASQQQLGEAGTIMAGTGGRVPFRDAGRVAQQYGGNPADWVKKTSSSHTVNGTTFETHWVENIRTGQRVEFKTKFP